MNPGDKYKRTVWYWDEAGLKHAVNIDIYDVLTAWAVNCPAVAHAIKKLLCPGTRGHKDRVKDLQEAAVSIQRAVELTRDTAPNPTETPP